MENNSKPKIVCLCGSTKFKKEYLEYQKLFTINSLIVLTVGFFGYIDGWDGDKKKLDELHLRKIDFADEVFVINVDGYIGESTRNEINYAIEQGKPVFYHHKI